jgi:DNA-binding MarR family transcriptional regulator
VLDLTDYTGYLLRNAFLQAAGLAARHFPKGEHPRDAGILATLEASGPLSQQRLADSLNVNRTMMVKLIDGLERRGLVTRQRNPEDRRSYALFVTAAGREALLDMAPVMDRAEEELAERLDAAERERLMALLSALTGPAPPALAKRLGFLITRVHHVFHERADQVLEPVGIEIRHFAALKALAHGVPSQRELADRLGVSTPVVVEMVDALEARGLVERRRDAADRRNNTLIVTDSGQATVTSATAELEAATAELTEAIGADGERELNALLRRLLGLPSARSQRPPASAAG